jgi:alkylation response protein AidB-like acyl-CoA dehydrogenase
MIPYEAPVADMQFVLRELIQFDDTKLLPDFEGLDGDLENAILEEAGKLCSEVLAPVRQAGDEHGCTWDDGVVTTSPGFSEAWQAFVEGGWTTLSCRAEHGGQGLPTRISMLVDEMVCSTNLAFGMFPGLTLGAYHAIDSHASDELRSTYLPRMASGEWAGTMCLTEPQCGTDLGLVRTRAKPAADGSYEMTGTKIFISAGEHDLTDNIIHLVLARTPDAPAGIRGISLFVVPKFAQADDGAWTAGNGVRCNRIEHKMGINGSPTCEIEFDGAKGWLVGVENSGMRNMFTMMNAARLGVANQGVGLAEAAYQGAVGYARERLQGRSLRGAEHPDKPADPIIVHPDVRRMLLTMRAYTEGSRALGAWIATELDVSRRHEDAQTRQDADDFVALMTPIAKALFTDIGFECANLGVQVFGGHGYVRDNGMEQIARDARIAQIYEGTNGIQALDLVGRKLPSHTGRLLRGFFHPVRDFLETEGSDPEMAPFVAPVAKAFERLQRATGEIAQSGLNDPNEAAAAATDYLRLFGLTALGYMWARSVRVSLDNQANDESGFYANKVATARFFVDRLLPQTSGLFAAIMAGGGSITEFREASF